MGDRCGDDKFKVDVPYFHTDAQAPAYQRRVVNVAELAINIKTILIDSNELAKNDPFTSAEFAVEMIESPAKVTFTVPQ